MFTRILTISLVECTIASASLAAPPPTLHDHPFRIHVVDAASNRGVPLITLTTTSNISFVTDSAGMIAFDEPGCENSDVHFIVAGHGYTYPKDGFGYTGLALRITPGGSATVKVNRTNIAQRLYRITGAGIYRDSIILGDTPPITQPLINGLVTGQDTVEVMAYNGKLFWFWGDTNRLAYPLGNFAVSGAISNWPGTADGLEPDLGVNLSYFVDDAGFSKHMCPIAGQPGPVWIDGLVVAPDPSTQRDTLLAHFVRVKTLGELYEQGFARWNDDKEIFEPIARIPLDATLYMRSHPFRARSANGVGHWYFPSPYPLIRARTDYASLTDITQYESFTCLTPGSRYDADDANPSIDRDSVGRVIWNWKRDTSPIGPAEQDALVKSGKLPADQCLLQLRDVVTGDPISAHSGSVHWNEHRQRWIMIAQQVLGSSMLGETWFAEADTLTGPWVYARKIVSHDKYTFYNVTQHPFFDRDHGRQIYFEGTYTTFISGAPFPTPRYDYNQVMYRLDLADPRLQLPVPVYEVLQSGAVDAMSVDYLTRDIIESRKAWFLVQKVAFFALPDANDPGGFKLLADNAAHESHAALKPVFPFSTSRSSAVYWTTDPDRDGVKPADREKPLGYAWPSPYADGFIPFDAQITEDASLWRPPSH